MPPEPRCLITRYRSSRSDPCVCTGTRAGVPALSDRLTGHAVPKPAESACQCPSPPPQHIVTRPTSLSERSSSCSSVVIRRAPVEPSGWPSAIAPPFTFTRSMSGSSSRRHAATTDANASLISTRSMSSIFIPLRSRSFFVAGIGPVSMITGSTPTVVWSTIRARGFSPSDSAFFRSMSSTAAAPSEICDELPAVILPSSLKAGFSSRQRLDARVRADALVGHVRVAVHRERHDLALEAALLGRLVRALVRAQADLVELRARDLPLVGDHLGGDPLRHEVVLLHHLGRPRASRPRRPT